MSITERCATCHGQHPPGCAYVGASCGLEFTCPKCTGAAFLVVGESGSEFCTATILECSCGARWEVLVMLSPVPHLREVA